MRDAATDFPASDEASTGDPILGWEVRLWRTDQWQIAARTADRHLAIEAATAFLTGGDGAHAEVWGPGRGLAYGEWVITDRLSA